MGRQFHDMGRHFALWRQRRLNRSIVMARGSLATSSPISVSAKKRGGGFASPMDAQPAMVRSEEHTSELQSLMRISYAVFCLKKKKKHIDTVTEAKRIKYHIAQ